MLALLARERSGRGALVTTMLFEAALASLANQATNYLVGGVSPQRMGSEHPNIVPYGSILTCQDGRELVIAAATERQYRELVRALGLTELADDPRYATGQQRVARRDELLGAMRARAATLSAPALAARLEAAKVPYGFVNDLAQVFAQPQADRLLLEAEQDGRRLRGVRTLAIGGSAATLASPGPPPHFDADRTRVLAELLGWSAAQMASAAAAGAFGPPAT